MPSNTSEKISTSFSTHGIPRHPKHVIPVPTPHTWLFSAGTSLTLCLSAWSHPDERLGMATAPLPPTGVLCHWLVPSAPTLSAVAFLQYRGAKLSWWGISSWAQPLLLPMGTFRKSGICMRRHRVFAQRKINKTPCASSPRLIFAALGNCCYPITLGWSSHPSVLPENRCFHRIWVSPLHLADKWWLLGSNKKKTHISFDISRLFVCKAELYQALRPPVYWKQQGFISAQAE